jgi:hypothetical protein
MVASQGINCTISSPTPHPTPLPAATSVYSLSPEEGVHVVTAGDDWFMHVSARTPYGCRATYEVSQPSAALRVTRTADGLDVELLTHEVGSTSRARFPKAYELLFTLLGPVSWPELTLKLRSKYCILLSERCLALV